MKYQLEYKHGDAWLRFTSEPFETHGQAVTWMEKLRVYGNHVPFRVVELTDEEAEEERLHRDIVGYLEENAEAINTVLRYLTREQMAQIVEEIK